MCMRAVVDNSVLWRGVRYKVPQNIDMQDRIIGPLTMIQFLYAVVGLGFCYGIYMTVPSPISVVLIVPGAMLTVALVFIKINERPFLDFLLAAVQFMSNPKQRIWHHQYVDNLRVVIYSPQKAKSSLADQSKSVSKEEIKQLAQKLDTE